MKKELKKILEDEKFVKELLTKETREEAKKAIEKKGVSVTDEEMGEIYKLYSAVYEKCKTMNKEDLDKIAGGVGGFLGKIKDFFVGDSIENSTYGIMNKEMVRKGLGCVVNVAKDVVGTIMENSSQALSNTARMQDRQASDQERRTNLMIGATAVGAVVGTGYLFKKEIKSWIKGK